MVNPEFAGGRPTMFICGNDASAKKTVAQILDQFGWDAEDMGAVEAARAIEPLCGLWCIPAALERTTGRPTRSSCCGDRGPTPYLSDALIASSAFDPGHNSRSESSLSG
jgi:hypothetical protein